jgi:hypothetical protein
MEDCLLAVLTSHADRRVDRALLPWSVVYKSLTSITGNVLLRNNANALTGRDGSLNLRRQENPKQFGIFRAGFIFPNNRLDDGPTNTRDLRPRLSHSFLWN